MELGLHRGLTCGARMTSVIRREALSMPHPRRSSNRKTAQPETEQTNARQYEEVKK